MLEDAEINLLRLKSRDAFHFARAIEAEVRKDDEALIRQMLESMCWAARVMTISEDEAPGYVASITAAKERLRDHRLPE